MLNVVKILKTVNAIVYTIINAFNPKAVRKGMCCSFNNFALNLKHYSIPISEIWRTKKNWRKRTNVLSDESSHTCS